MKLDVLAIGAHPDDVELTCGGTLIKMIRKGRRVGILDLTHGELGTRGSKELRTEEAEEASRRLGVGVRLNLGLADGNFDVTAENRLKIVSVLRQYRPDVLFIPHWLERHPDHERAHRLARDAWFYAGVSKMVTTGEDGSQQDPFRPRAFFHYMQWFEFEPSFIVDITDEFEARMEAMMAFSSQFYTPGDGGKQTALSTPEFLEMIRTRLAYFGDRIGVGYGEPFYYVGSIGVDDPLSLHVT